MTKADLFSIIDGLPESKVVAAGQALARVRDNPPEGDPFPLDHAHPDEIEALDEIANDPHETYASLAEVAARLDVKLQR